jgi:hypothetical protein
LLRVFLHLVRKIGVKLDECREGGMAWAHPRNLGAAGIHVLWRLRHNTAKAHKTLACA